MRRLAVAGLLVALAACEGRSRTRNSAGGELNEASASPTAGNVYRFVNVDQSLKDARGAAQAEKWADAQAAAQALLRQQPGHIEAQKIADQAGVELANQGHFTAFIKAVGAKDNFTGGAAFRAITETSVYYERARPDYERMREQWVAVRENEARALARVGRCRDAHRIARAANDTYPEMRPRLDLVADNCRPAVGQEIEPDPPTAVSPPVASLTAAAPDVTAAPAPLPEPPPDARPVAVIPPPPPPPAPTPTPAPPAAPSKPKLVASFELEKLRTAGDKRPPLPAGANMIAHRDHVASIVVGVALCLSEAGAPTSVELVKASGYEDADEKIVHDVREWRFQPYVAGGQAVPVCTRMVFNYQIE